MSITNSIFLHHDGALGDVLLSLPCIRAIRDGGGAVHFAGRRDIGMLLKHAGLADEASDAGGSSYAPLHAGSDPSGVLKAYAKAYLFTAMPGSPLEAAFRSSVKDTRVIATIPPDGEAAHVAEYRWRQFSNGAAFPEETRLPLPRDLVGMAEALLVRSGYDNYSPLVALHPGSGGAEKRWPVERFETVADALQKERGAYLLLLTGPAEDDVLKDRVEGFVRGRERAQHIADTDLMAAAALLGRCSLYIGNDSGATHLAAAAGCPVVALFGPTDPARWRPRGNAVRTVRAERMELIGGDDVRAAALAMLDAGKERGTA